MIKNTLKKSLALGLLMTFLITGSVWAEGTTTATETNDGIFIGNTVGNPSSSESASTGKNIVAMGQNIEYTQESKNIVSLGNNIKSDGNRLIYIGSGINNENDPDAIKQNIIAYIKNIITGNESELNQFDNINLVAIGSGIDIQGKNSIAIGMGVTVEANNAVAIGAGSAATEDNTVSFGRGKEEITLSDGKKITVPEINRTLTHVAKGEIALDSTDAINGSQLYDITRRITDIDYVGTSDTTTIKNNVAISGNTSVNGSLSSNSAVINENVIVGKNINIGKNAIINGSVSADSASINKDATIGENINVGKNAIINGSVNADSASINKDATIGENINVGKDAIIKGSISADTASINKNATIGENINVGGNAIVKGSVSANTASINKDVTIGENLTVDGSASFANGKFNVAENGDVSVGGSKLTIEAATGNTNVDGTLNVAGNTVLDNNLNVKGNAAFDENVNIDGTLNLTGKLTATGGAAITAENGGKLSVDSNGVGLASNTNSILAVTDNGICLANNNSLVVIDSAGTTFANGSSQGLTNINGGNITTTGTASFANGNFTIDNVGNTTIAGTLDVTSTNGQLTVKDNYVATIVSTSGDATTAGSINTGGFIGERVKNSDGSEFTATGKNTDGIINVAYKNGDYTDVLQTSSGINVITKSANDNTFGSQTALGTEITGTDVSIEDPKNTANRIYLSDVGQVKNVDSELKANSNYIDSPTVVGAINAEADIRRAQFAKLGNKIEKVGAGAAALAAMHPLDFDPDDKLQFSAGVGNYGGETATALGAFYRPTEKVMFNIAGTMGNDENMMNAGITFALDGRNNVSNSRVAMAREIQDLRAQVAQLTNNQAQMMALLNKVLDGQADELLANVMFPDVPENHWAYEYLDSLQKRGIIKGYPDGSFSGDRSLTRYEYATMLCRVLDQGIPVDTRLLDEFEAELGRIRIDRIKGKDDSANKIERVRVNSSSDRDDYGSQIINTSAPTAN